MEDDIKMLIKLMREHRNFKIFIGLLVGFIMTFAALLVLENTLPKVMYFSLLFLVMFKYNYNLITEFKEMKKSLKETLIEHED